MIIDGSICNDYRPRLLLLTNPTDTFTEDYNLWLLKIDPFHQFRCPTKNLRGEDFKIIIEKAMIFKVDDFKIICKVK